MSLVKLSLLAALVLLLSLATARLKASVDEPERYQQRIWYPRGPMRDEWLRSGRQRDTPRTEAVGLKGPTMRARPRQEKREAGHQFAYMVSPLSEQILEVGGRRDWSFAWPPAETTREPADGDQCQTISSMLVMGRDEVDKLTGQVLRHCKGLVAVNKCEGTCGSYVQPSVKSLTGLKKECSCCNEGSFRRIQVRLGECYSPTDQRLIKVGEAPPQMDHMDVFVDEPIECKCRPCDTIF